MPRVSVLIVVGLLAASASARAAKPSFSVQNATVTPGIGERLISQFYPQYAGQGARVEAALNDQLSQVAGLLSQQINDQLGSLDFDGFGGAMANAAAAMNKGLPFDYASDPAILTFTFGVGAAVNNLNPKYLDFQRVVADLQARRVEPFGVAAGGSFLLGINLKSLRLPSVGFFDPGRLTLYLSFTKLAPTLSGVDIDYLALGAHAQYRIVNGIGIVPGGLLRWSGLSLGTGVDYTRVSVGVPFPLPSGEQDQSFDYGGQSLALKAAWSGKGRLDARTNMGSIPIEAMTSLQMLYLLTLYGGVAMDLNFGSATLSAVGRDPVEVSVADPSGARGSLQVAEPTPSLTFDGAYGPTVGDMRAFVGAQVNLYVLGVYAQMSFDTARSIGVNGGLRAYW